MKKLFIFSVFIILFSGCDLGDPMGKAYGTTPLDNRGMIFINEAHYAGSIRDSGGNYNPDDDFIELGNAYEGVLDISGWTVKIESENYVVLTIPKGTIIKPNTFFTIGNNTNGAFRNFDMVATNLKLNSRGFKIEITDGGGAKESDAVDFTIWTYLPAGYDLPRLKKSAIRRQDYFGPLPASSPDNWISYNAPSSSTNVRSEYAKSVYASPGSPLGGGAEGGDSDESGGE